MKGAVLILVSLLLLGCSEEKDSQRTHRLVLFTSIPPQTGLAKAICGDRAEVCTLVGEGQSPHSYEPTTRQLAKLREADAYFAIGVPFEKRLLDKIASLYPELPIIDTHENLTLLYMDDQHHEEQDENGLEMKDPHVWLSPTNALAISKSMTLTLLRLDPVNAETYQANFEKLAARLQQLDEEIRSVLAPCRGCRFYVFHPSFGYFADAYGLEQVSVEIDGKSPSPRQLGALIEQALADDVHVIFVQRQFPASSAKAVADAIKGKVVQLDPLAEDVVANLRQIAESIAESY